MTERDLTQQVHLLTPEYLTLKCVEYIWMELPWLRLQSGISWFLVQLLVRSSCTGCWYIEMFRDTAVYEFKEDLFFRFSEWRIPEVMPFLPGYFRG